MMTKTLTLTEFLLARIAEDEDLLEREDRVYGGGGEVWTVTAYRRALAECEAKRRIVGLCIPAGVDDDGRDFYVGGYGEAYLDVLRALATVHADHPDYRQEWTPR